MGSAANDVFQWNGLSTFTSINGGAGNDTLSAAAATSAVSIDLRNAQYSNIEFLQGSNNGDLLSGSGTINSTIVGGTGADSLYGGGASNDILTGGGGADTYWFSSGDANDTISAAPATNSLGTVNFYGLTTGGVLSTVMTGNDLAITLTSGDKLTLLSWDPAGTNKLNRFAFSTGTYSLTVSGSTPTWTLIA